MKTATIGVLAALAVLLVSFPAAASKAEPTGARISLFSGNQTFPANQPFHISHGWAIVPDFSDYDAIGKYDFTLAVDGTAVDADFVDKFFVLDPVFGQRLARFPVFNFPTGMTGSHTFTGRWFGPCQAVVDGGFVPGPCDKPTAVVSAFGPLTIQLTFAP